MHTYKSIAGREWPMISQTGRTIAKAMFLIAITGGLLSVNKPLSNLQKTGQTKRGISNYKPASKIIIKGRVVRRDNGSPLTGAIVKANGTNIGVVTDANGRFTLYVDSNKTELIVSSTDYNTLQLNIQKYDSLKTIELEPNDSSLDESIVMGYNKNVGDSKETNAHPNLGWDNLKKYLKENAVLPAGKTGIVKLSFYVHNDGTITAIKVINACDKVTGQKAIDLINDGPGWIGNINGRTEKVNLTVDFNK